ncbi:type 1 glutamine amidotransferase [Prolixibacter sp. NT017]|uniref:type 1 glutamine amidotransferase n=1 Tax=Prolixibacter sp. NT017 TaxID=2652390 RepID=UPI00127E412D|nr:type 1 glutamine amidotransferase [Prolixibacter sp. NT017]GET24796.1 amidotransferase [Prolixibacter sp. NT017]
MKPIRIHYLQHVSFEGLGCIEQWITRNHHTLTVTRFFENDELPSPSDFDMLIIMGGPMGIYDDEKYPWLTEERLFIRQAIDANKTVLGICLGSQFIADAMGAKVYPNREKEIGWFDISLTDDGRQSRLLNGFDETFPVFHWHGDTFELPSGAMHLFQSEGCLNQAFLRDNVLGLQFHFEVTLESLTEMVKHGKEELTAGKYIQSAEEILAHQQLIPQNNELMFTILDRITRHIN